MRFVVEHVTYYDHPYLQGVYFRIFDKKFNRYRLGIYTTESRANQVLNGLT